MALGVPQGRLGSITIGGVVYPAYNVAYSSPRNLMTPPIISRDAQKDFAEGVRTARLTLNLCIYDIAIASGGALGTTFLNLFLARSSDDTTSFTLIYDDGAERGTIANCKAESFTISGAKGGLINFSAVFLGPAPATKGATVAPTSFARNTPITSKHTTFPAGANHITDPIYGFEFSFANNHLLNAPIATTNANHGLGGLSWDTGMKQAGASFTLKSQNATMINDQAKQLITFTGANLARTFQLTSLVPENPDDQAYSIGQVYRNVACAVLADDTDGPIKIS